MSIAQVVSVINFTGGEPLQREDIPEIIRSVNKDLSTAILFTNGWFLKERINDLKRSGLDSVYVSLDSYQPQQHDMRRGKEGLFNRAVEGIVGAKRAGFSVGISCCITPESFMAGELDKIIDLGRELGVHEILVYDAVPTGRYKNRRDLVGENDWIEKMIASVNKYNCDPSYPGILVYAYTTSHRSLGCSCGVNYLYISPYGDVCPCDFNHVIFGNVLNQPLYKIWDYMTSLIDFSCAKWGDCKLKDPKWQDKKTVSSEFVNYV